MINKKTVLALTFVSLAFCNDAAAATANEVRITARSLYTKFNSATIPAQQLNRLIGEIDASKYVNTPSNFVEAPTTLEGFLSRLTNIAEDVKPDAVDLLNKKLARVQSILNNKTELAE